MPTSSRPPPPEIIDQDERPTLVPCFACGGDGTSLKNESNGRYKMSQCRWCLNGAMSPAQIRAWHDRLPSSRR